MFQFGDYYPELVQVFPLDYVTEDLERPVYYMEVRFYFVIIVNLSSYRKLAGWLPVSMLSLCGQQQQQRTSSTSLVGNASEKKKKKTSPQRSSRNLLTSWK